MAGVKGRSGRRPEARTARLNELIDKIWTPERREACLTMLIDDCESKEFAVRSESRKLLLAYTFGKPTEYRVNANLPAPLFDSAAKLVELLKTAGLDIDQDRAQEIMAASFQRAGIETSESVM